VTATTARRPHRWLWRSLIIAVVVLIAMVVAFSVFLRWAQPGAPSAFYDPPEELPAGELRGLAPLLDDGIGGLAGLDGSLGQTERAAERAEQGRSGQGWISCWEQNLRQGLYRRSAGGSRHWTHLPCYANFMHEPRGRDLETH